MTTEALIDDWNCPLTPNTLSVMSIWCSVLRTPVSVALLASDHTVGGVGPFPKGPQDLSLCFCA